MSENSKWKYCVVGNIVKERIDDDGILRHGTAAFKGGTKVYLEGKNFYSDLRKIEVLGLNRHGRYAREYVPKELIENVRFTRTFNPKIIELMYDYEEFDWWGNSDEDGLEAKLFAMKWPVIQKSSSPDFEKWFCEKPITMVYRLRTPGYDEDLWEELDYQHGMVYHVMPGYWLVFETEKCLITIGIDGVQEYPSAEDMLKDGRILFTGKYDLENIVFPGNQIHSVKEDSGGWVINFSYTEDKSGLSLRVISHSAEEEFTGEGFLEGIPFEGFDKVLYPCLCGGRPAFMMNRQGDFYVECRKCHMTMPYTDYDPKAVVNMWNRR